MQKILLDFFQDSQCTGVIHSSIRKIAMQCMRGKLMLLKCSRVNHCYYCNKPCQKKPYSIAKAPHTLLSVVEVGLLLLPNANAEAILASPSSSLLVSSANGMSSVILIAAGSGADCSGRDSAGVGAYVEPRLLTFV